MAIDCAAPSAIVAHPGGDMAKCEGWCGACYTNAKGRTNAKGHAFYRHPPRSCPVGEFPMRKPASSGGKRDGSEPRPRPEGDCEMLPSLWEFLTHRQWDDGTPRQPGSVTVFYEDGVWKACLNDRDAGLVAFRTAPTPIELAVSLEGALARDTLEWRRSTAQGKRR